MQGWGCSQSGAWSGLDCAPHSLEDLLLVALEQGGMLADLQGRKSLPFPRFSQAAGEGSSSK